MRRLILATVAAAMLALAGPALADSDQDFNLVNRTGFEIDQVFVSPTSSNQWGSDVLGQAVLPNGSTAAISFPSGTRPCRWDLRVVYSDGGAANWGNINLCSISRVQLFYNRQTDVTTYSAD